jgi:uncharacterized protein YcbK (DUF882 family)
MNNQSSSDFTTTPYDPPVSFEPHPISVTDTTVPAPMPEPMPRSAGPKTSDLINNNPNVGNMKKNKCLEPQDLSKITQYADSLQSLVSQSPNPMGALSNPQFVNTIHDLLDELDKVNVVCAATTNTKCDMVSNVNKQGLPMLEIANTMLNVYSPILVRVILMIEKITNNLSKEKACNLDPKYVESVKNLKQRLVGSEYMKNINGLKYKEANNKLRMMSVNSLNNNIEKFEITANNININTYDVIVILLVLFFLYIIYLKFNP